MAGIGQIERKAILQVKIAKRNRVEWDKAEQYFPPNSQPHGDAGQPKSIPTKTRKEVFTAGLY